MYYKRPEYSLVMKIEHAFFSPYEPADCKDFMLNLQI